MANPSILSTYLDGWGFFASRIVTSASGYSERHYFERLLLEGGGAWMEKYGSRPRLMSTAGEVE